MRKLILTVTMAGLICLPVLAQFPGMMGRGMDANSMLQSKDIQKELKLTDDQLKTLASAQKDMQKAMQTAREDMDFEAMRKGMEEYGKTLGKIREGLKGEQKKRFFQLEIQDAAKRTSPDIFKNEEVQKGLSLTTAQKDKIKTSLTELEKDRQELAEDAKGDFSKMREMFTKVNTLNKDTYDKITKSLSDDQKKAWKELQGDEFKGEFRPPFGKGKGGKREKPKDDF
jgi:hypothetical protein